MYLPRNRCTDVLLLNPSISPSPNRNSASRTSYIVLFSTSFQTEHLDQPIPPSRPPPPPVYIPNKSICNCSTSKNFLPYLSLLACLLSPVRCSYPIAKVRNRKKKLIHVVDQLYYMYILVFAACFTADTTNDTTIGTQNTTKYGFGKINI